MIHFKLWLILQESTNKKLPTSRKAKDILKIVKLNDHKYKIYKSAKGNNQKLLKLKYKEAQKDGLLEDVLENGIKNPIEIKIDKYGNQILIKVHHRLAISLKHLQKRLIKIKYI